MAADAAVYCLFAGLLGLLIGSFLNVCIYRVPRDLSVVAPRSFCPECRHPIASYDNIPVLSYLVLRGRCRHCGKRIGIRYSLVELATAVLFASVAAQYGLTLETFKWCLFEAILVVLFCTDLEERILPDEFTLGGALSGLMLSAFVNVPSNLAAVVFSGGLPERLQSLLNATAGCVLLAVPIWLLGAAYARLRGRVGLGAGDVKLLLCLGAFLGVEDGVLALLIGSVSGSVIGVMYIFLARKNAAEYWLPFGTFLCAGAAVTPFAAKTFPDNLR